MKKRFKTLLTLVAITTAILLSGCSSESTPTPSPSIDFLLDGIETSRKASSLVAFPNSNLLMYDEVTYEVFIVTDISRKSISNTIINIPHLIVDGSICYYDKENDCIVTTPQVE